MAFANLPAPVLWSARGYLLGTTGATLDAANEACFLIGEVYLPDLGAGGSRTISAAGGGALYWNSASGNVYANAGTTSRFGIMDVNASGAEDGTFDVSADLVGGTDTITNNILNRLPMESGSKSLAHGQLIAVGVKMISRAGADALSVDRVIGSSAALTLGRPYGTLNGSGPVQSIARFLLQFDDGTYGWINGAPLLFNSAVAKATINFNNGTTPDEYVTVIRVAAPARITAFGWPLAAIASADTFEAIYYTDPLGTPVAAVTITPDPDQLLSGEVQLWAPSSPIDLQVGTDYGFAIRPTSANSITWPYYDLTSGFDELKVQQPFSAIQMAARTNQTGPFVETQAYHLPDFFLQISGFDDGEGGDGSPGGSPSESAGGVSRARVQRGM